MAYFIAQGINATFGVLLQLCVALLLASLFLARASTKEAKGLGTWGIAWLAQSVAVAALVTRFVLLPNLDMSHLQEGSPQIRALYTTYGVAKVAFFALVATASVHLAPPRGRRRMLAGIWGAALLQACLAAAAAGDLNRVVQWNSPFAAACELLAAFLVWRHAERHPARGRVLAVLLAMAVLALVDVEVFREMAAPDLAALRGFRLWLHGGEAVHYNSYLDVMLHLLLAAGILDLSRVRGAAARSAPAAPG